MPNINVRRACGHVEDVTFKGNPAAWKEREELLKKQPCKQCHIEQLRGKVKSKIPTLTELCFGSK